MVLLECPFLLLSVLLEGALDEELDEELGYSKYDYRNKETDKSRNGHSSKTMHTSYGDMDVAIPRDRNGDYEPQLIKKYQNTVTQDMEEKILSLYAKGMTTGDIESHIHISITGVHGFAGMTVSAVVCFFVTIIILGIS